MNHPQAETHVVYRYHLLFFFFFIFFSLCHPPLFRSLSLFFTRGQFNFILFYHPLTICFIIIFSAPEPTTKKRARSVRNGPGDVHQRLPKKSFQARPQVLWSSPQAAEHHHEHDDDDGAPSMVSGAVAMVVSAVEALAAEVRALRDDNRHIHVQLDAMKARQHACDSALASLLHGNHYQQSTVGSAPRKVRKASARLTGNRSCENAEERPSAAVLEAIRELTFLDDYPSLTGFAVPDFRFPVLACAYAGAGSRPTIIYANAAACQLTEYSWVRP